MTDLKILVLGAALCAMLAGCAVSSTGEISRLDPSRLYSGAYPGCRADLYFPNANCYGGPP